MGDGASRGGVALPSARLNDDGVPAELVTELRQALGGHS